MIVSREGSSQDHIHDNFLLTLLSLSAVKASQKKLLYRGEGTHFSNGRVIPQGKIGELRSNGRSVPQRLLLLHSATQFIPRLLMHPPGHRFCLYDEMGSNHNFLYLSKFAFKKTI